MAVAPETRLKNVRKRVRHPLKRETVVLYKDDGSLYYDYGEPNQRFVTQEELSTLTMDPKKVVIICEYVDVTSDGRSWW